MNQAPPVLRLAVLGCGSGAELDARALRSLGPRVALSFASRTAERARLFSRRFDGCASFGSYEEALDSPQIDAVLVATPPAGHLDLTLRALGAGKHVIVEKPPFLRAADFEAVRAAERGSGRRALVAENYHYKPLARALRRLLRERAVGEPLFLQVSAVKTQAVSGWRADTALAGGGALFEGGIHWVNLMANLGLEVRAAHGFGPDPAGRERSLLAVFEYAGGAVGTLAYSWEVPSPLKGLRVSRLHGREGSIAFESNGLWLAVWGRRKRLLFPGLFDLTGRRAMLRDFVTALRTGAPAEYDLDRARRDLELVERLYASLAARADARAAPPPR